MEDGPARTRGADAARGTPKPGRQPTLLPSRPPMEAAERGSWRSRRRRGQRCGHQRKPADDWHARVFIVNHHLHLSQSCPSSCRRRRWRFCAPCPTSHPPPVAASARASAGCSDPLKVLHGRLLPMAFEYAFVPRGMPGHIGHVLPPDAAWRRVGRTQAQRLAAGEDLRAGGN